MATNWRNHRLHWNKYFYIFTFFYIYWSITMMMYNDSYCKHKDYFFSYLLVYITILKSVSWHIKVTTIPYSNIYDFNRVLSFLVKHEIKYRSEEQKQLSLTKWIMNCLPKKPSWSRLVPAFNVFMCFWPFHRVYIKVASCWSVNRKHV